MTWDTVLFDRHVHPTQVAVMEAMEWLGVQFSPVQFASMSGDEMDAGHAGYHFRKLAEAGLIQCVGTRQVRGAMEHFYVRAT